MKNILADKNLIAYCGLYCGACSKYLKQKCPGCRDNQKANWCIPRKCCIDNELASCADCRIKTVENCKDYNNFMAKVFGFIFKSDRKACINLIKEIGYEQFAIKMAHSKKMTLKKGKTNI